MSLDVGRAIREGASRLTTPLGQRFVLLFIGIRFASTVVSHTLTAANRVLMEQMPADAPPIDFGPAATPFALPLPLPAALVIALAVAIGAEAAHIAAIRFLAEDDPEAVESASLTRRLGPATLHGFVGGIVVTVLTVIGLIVLVAPGIFLAVTFLFVRQEIAVRDRSVVDALADSWSLTAGNRVEVLIILLVLFAVGVVASLPSLALSGIEPIARAVVGVALSALTTVFGIAVVSRGYAQLDADRADRLAIE